MTTLRLTRLAMLGLTLSLAACGDDEKEQQPQTYTLTVELAGPGDGTVTGQGIACGDDCTEVYDAGTEVTLTADPDAGFALDFWEGCTPHPGDTCTVTMSADVTVTATWSQTFR